MNPPRRVTISSSIKLDKEDVTQLSLLLPEFVCEFSAANFDQLPLNTSTSATSGPWQQELGLSVSLVLTIALAPLPALFLKGLVEEAGKEVCRGIIALFTRIAKRNRSVPLRALWLRIDRESETKMSVRVDLLLPDAAHQEPENASAVLQEALRSLDAHTAAVDPLLTAIARDEVSSNWFRRNTVVFSYVARAGSGQWVTTVEKTVDYGPGGPKS